MVSNQRPLVFKLALDRKWSRVPSYPSEVLAWGAQRWLLAVWSSTFEARSRVFDVFISCWGDLEMVSISGNQAAGFQSQRGQGTCWLISGYGVLTPVSCRIKLWQALPHPGEEEEDVHGRELAPEGWDCGWGRHWTLAKEASGRCSFGIARAVCKQGWALYMLDKRAGGWPGALQGSSVCLFLGGECPWHGAGRALPLSASSWLPCRPGGGICCVFCLSSFVCNLKQSCRG